MRIDITALRRLDQVKAVSLETMLNDSASLNGFIARNSLCQINTSTTEYNPASIWNPDVVNPRGSLLIEIAEWFFRNYTAGYIVGMLCHEVGAHYMADHALRVQPVSPLPGLVARPITHAVQAVPRSRQNSEEQLKDRASQVQDAATNWSYTASDAKQPDHIFASCYGYARYHYYRGLMIEFAEIIALYRRNDPDSFAAQDLPDLIDCWLMDISSILATKDARGWGPAYAWWVSTAYAAHLARLKADVNVLTADADVRAAVQNTQNKSSARVFADYGQMIPRLFM
ncbi:hypothetical protein ATI61_108272 [Archangium gephyra]|uniref:Uncharacterized protein n=1 Tax=Archangium gephyra TaxID=48 RepID=A0AAC8Q7H7_9BACT|nr:hypothetical protein [Archangium gephyra]AKJ02339.1 Hypothetical protein AA314_03965 [Archangium gephyra]REG28731.1 hypothetical protein ATI61_108272 [Archangium gephyra]